MVDFTQIPGSYNVPGAYTEVAFMPPTGAFDMPVRTLIIAIQQTLASGSKLYQNASSSQLRALLGIGSNASIAASAIEATSPGMPMDVLAIAPGTGAVQAKFSVAFTGPATASGTKALYVGGQRVTFGISAGDSAATIATNFASCLTSDILSTTGLWLAATPTGATVAIGASEASQYGNDLDLRDSPYASDAVAGVGVSVATTTPGAGAPSISAALASVSAIWYTSIVTLLYDTANLLALSNEAARRFGAMVKQDARVYAAIRGSYGNLLQITSQLNSPYLQILGAQNPMWPLALAAGAFAGACELSLDADPAVQMRTLDLAPLAGMAPQGGDLFLSEQRNVLLGSGLSTFNVAQDGTVTLERVVTTYQTDSAGVALAMPQDIMVPAIASRVRYGWNAQIEAFYPRAKLADDSSVLRNVAGVVTPATLRGSWISWCRVCEARGWIEDVDTLGPLATFERNAFDRDRVDSVLPIKPIGSLIIDANLLQVQG